VIVVVALSDFWDSGILVCAVFCFRLCVTIVRHRRSGTARSCLFCRVCVLRFYMFGVLNWCSADIGVLPLVDGDWSVRQ